MARRGVYESYTRRDRGRRSRAPRRSNSRRNHRGDRYCPRYPDRRSASPPSYYGSDGEDHRRHNMSHDRRFGRDDRLDEDSRRPQPQPDDLENPQAEATAACPDGAPVPDNKDKEDGSGGPSLTLDMGNGVIFYLFDDKDAKQRARSARTHGHWAELPERGHQALIKIEEGCQELGIFGAKIIATRAAPNPSGMCP